MVPGCKQTAIRNRAAQQVPAEPDTLRGPSTNVFDFALLKDFPVRERANLQFRWEVFNLFNHALFGQPTSNLSSGSVDKISSLPGDPRLMQFALRLPF